MGSSSIKIEEDCPITPNIRVKNVPNPHLIYPEIKTLLIEKIEIDPFNVNEEKYEHTKLEGKEKVKAVIKAKKDVDRLTSIQYKLEVEIEMRPVNKGEILFVGDALVKVKSKVSTEYPQKTRLERSWLADMFRTFYEKTLYKDQREVYMDKCKNKTSKIRDEIQSFFNLLPKMV